MFLSAVKWDKGLSESRGQSAVEEFVSIKSLFHSSKSPLLVNVLPGRGEDSTLLSLGTTDRNLSICTLCYFRLLLHNILEVKIVLFTPSPTTYI